LHERRQAQHNAAMRVVKGKVVGNTVVLEEPVPEGSAVDVVLHETDDSPDFALTDEMRRELREASEAAKRGEAIDLDVLLTEVAALR
jgi:hypothetical protein